MIVVLVEKLGSGDEARSFGGIACDVEGCTAHEPQKPEPKNLLVAGWYIAPGVHRCPEHYHVDTPVRETRHEVVGKVTKRL